MGLALLVLLGVVTGVVNALAGGGSLLTLPALIALGLPAATANGTNRIAVLLHSTLGSVRFHQKGVLDLRAALRVLPITVVGAVVGAWASLQLGETGLRRAMGVVLLVVLVVLWLKPQDRLRDRDGALPGWIGQLLFLGVGLYGGFIQAGVGVLLLAAFVVAVDDDLVRANAAKLVFVCLFTVPALVIFAVQGHIALVPGLALAGGAMAGAEIGTRLAIAKGAPLIRWMLTVVVVVAALNLLRG